MNTKPTEKEWIKWATDNKVSAEALEYVKKNPHVLHTIEAHNRAHEEAAKNNPYIFQPRRSK